MTIHRPHPDPALIRQRLHRPVVLVGMMAAGKSHLGRILAAALDCDFVDTDTVIEQKTGLSIAEIFARRGEQEFRDIEQATIAQFLTAGAGLRVIATGGGAIMRPASAALIFGDTISVWVRASIPTILKRTARGRARPLLQNANPQKVIEDLMAARNDMYARADIVIDTDDTTPAWMKTRILEEIEKRLLPS